MMGMELYYNSTNVLICTFFHNITDRQHLYDSWHVYLPYKRNILESKSYIGNFKYTHVHNTWKTSDFIC